MIDRPICQTCTKNLADKMYRQGRGHVGYYSRCKACRGGIKRKEWKRRYFLRAPDRVRALNKVAASKYRAKRNKRRDEWLLEHGCQVCGFRPVHKCQIDKDHIDGNHANNDPSNIQFICANCHRLKTLREGEQRAHEREQLKAV